MIRLLLAKVLNNIGIAHIEHASNGSEGLLLLTRNRCYTGVRDTPCCVQCTHHRVTLEARWPVHVHTIFGSITHSTRVLGSLCDPLQGQYWHCFPTLMATHWHSGVSRFLNAHHARPRVHYALSKMGGSSTNDRRLEETSGVRYLESMRSVCASHFVYLF